MMDTVGTRSAKPVLKIRTSQVNVQQHSSDTPRHLCIEVSDTGKGMNPSMKQKIFKPFFTTKEQGTGLGLAIVEMVTKKHDGFIDVASEEGKGTTVKLFFPLVQIIPESVSGYPRTIQNNSLR
jgi:signal transduction histidine kinase